MDRERFDRLCRETRLPQNRAGIGTLGEKTLHAVLKRYFSPDFSCHEVKIGRYVADIATDAGIIEIQTQSFQAIRNKLEAFLEHSPVTVVYPIAQTKWLCWINEESGEITKRRKSPKAGIPCDACYELYKIKHLLKNPNLRLRLLLLELEEYRYLNGWSSDKKRGSVRCERIPIALHDEIYLQNCTDYACFLPETLPAPFTTKDFAKAAKRLPPAAQKAVHVLHHLGVIKRVGKTGNFYLYEIA